MTKIAVATGSTRPGRNGEAVARWALDVASRRSDAQFELVDALDQRLPFLDEALPPSSGQYTNQHTVAWASLIAGFDVYLFVTPEYNHSTSPALLNAIDYLFGEWADKAAGFVSYGTTGGVRAVEHLRGVAAELRLATVRSQVALSLVEDFEGYTRFTPRPQHEARLTETLDQLIAWSNALAPLRTEQ